MKKALVLLCLGSLIALPALSAERRTAAAGTKTAPAPAHSAPARKSGLVQQASGQGYGMAGCGLGSILFGEQPGMVQIFAATTNGWAGTQTFGITSGTSNCTDHGGGATAALFITANREALEKDIARGSGETITTLSQIMGCQAESQAQLGQALQRNYSTIFPSQKAPTDGVVDSIVNTVKGDSSLSKSCASVG